MTSAVAVGVPHEPLRRLFLRFLRFGMLAWGGPVAQIAMLRRSMVDEERWVSGEHFNRALALYQVLPGPEAHELCVYFGMLARGRIGGILAGLGFMLPGFLLMFALSWAYVSLGLDVHGTLAVLFAAIQAAVIALIVRAVHRIGSHVLLNAWLWAIAIVAAAAHFAGVHFALILFGAGVAYLFLPASRLAAAALIGIAGLATLIWYVTNPGNALIAEKHLEGIASGSASLATLFWSGLKAGSLTFGGAYTVIPFLQRDAVSTGAWMSNAQFMDGIALAGLLPAPLVIFATFVGYVGGGPAGALVMTIGVFLPAFALTLIAHEPMERLIHERRVRTFLDGITAGVVGLIAATALGLMLANIRGLLTGAVFLVALATLFYWNHRFVIPLVIAAATITGLAAMWWMRTP
jgi:chromate transporter